MYDATRLGIADEFGYGYRPGVGLRDRGLDGTVKKILILVGLIMAVGLARIAAEAAVYNPAGQALKVVAAVEDSLLDKVIAATEIGVRSQTTGKTATGWGVARFAGSAIGPLLTIGLAVGGVAWSPYIEPWLVEKGWFWEDGQVRKNVQTGVYELAPGATGYGAMSWYSSYIAKTINVTGFRPYGTYIPGSIIHSSAMAQGGWSSTIWACYNQSSDFANPYNVLCKPGQTYASYVQLQTIHQAVPEADLKSGFETSFQTDQSNARAIAQALIDYLGPMVKEANKDWPGTVPKDSGYAPMTASQGATVQQTMNDAIDPKAKAELQQYADANGTSAPPGSNTGPAAQDWEYTPDQMAQAWRNQADSLDQAQYQAFADNGGGDDNGDDNITGGTFTIPERQDLSAILVGYMTTVSGLPLVSAIQGSGVVLSNESSTVDLPKPEFMGGGIISINFAQYEWFLVMMGNMLYTVVSLRWLIWLFMGRGDA